MILNKNMPFLATSICNYAENCKLQILKLWNHFLVYWLASYALPNFRDSVLYRLSVHRDGCMLTNDLSEIRERFVHPDVDDPVVFVFQRIVGHRKGFHPVLQLLGVKAQEEDDPVEEEDHQKPYPGRQKEVDP